MDWTLIRTYLATIAKAVAATAGTALVLVLAKVGVDADVDTLTGLVLAVLNGLIVWWVPNRQAGSP